MKALDHVAFGVRAGLAGGVEAIRRYFLEEMTAEDHLEFDGLLLRSEDELRFMAGPVEERFVERCSRMMRGLQEAPSRG
jgi:hypothetical protein